MLARGLTEAAPTLGTYGLKHLQNLASVSAGCPASRLVIPSTLTYYTKHRHPNFISLQMPPKTTIIGPVALVEGSLVISF